MDTTRRSPYSLTFEEFVNGNYDSQSVKNALITTEKGVARSEAWSATLSEYRRGQGESYKGFLLGGAHYLSTFFLVSWIVHKITASAPLILIEMNDGTRCFIPGYNSNPNEIRNLQEVLRQRSIPFQSTVTLKKYVSMRVVLTALLLTFIIIYITYKGIS